MGAGTFKFTGNATVPAGTPDSAGYVEIADEGLSADDRVFVTISDVDYQNLGGRKRDDITVQVVKNAGVGLTIGANQKQNPEFDVDYIIFTGS